MTSNLWQCVPLSWVQMKTQVLYRIWNSHLQLAKLLKLPDFKTFRCLIIFCQPFCDMEAFFGFGLLAHEVSAPSQSHNCLEWVAFLLFHLPPGIFKILPPTIVLPLQSTDRIWLELDLCVLTQDCYYFSHRVCSSSPWYITFELASLTWEEILCFPVSAVELW